MSFFAPRCRALATWCLPLVLIAPTAWAAPVAFPTNTTAVTLDGAPLAAAMKLSLHRSAVQAQKYYADVEISENPATDLLGD